MLHAVTVFPIVLPFVFVSCPYLCSLNLIYLTLKVVSNWQALVFTVTLKNLLTPLLTEINMFKLRGIKNSSRYTLCYQARSVIIIQYNNIY